MEILRPTDEDLKKLEDSWLKHCAESKQIESFSNFLLESIEKYKQKIDESYIDKLREVNPELWTKEHLGTFMNYYFPTNKQHKIHSEIGRNQN